MIFSIKIRNILMIGSYPYLVLFPWPFWTWHYILHLSPKGFGVKLNPFSWFKPKKVLIETFKAFSMTKEYFQLLYIRKIQLARLENSFDKNFLQILVFWILISFMFLHIFLLLGKISELPVPHFLRMNISVSLNLILYW